MDICALEVGVRALSDHIPSGKSVLYRSVLCLLHSSSSEMRSGHATQGCFSLFSNREDEEKEKEKEQEKVMVAKQVMLNLGRRTGSEWMRNTMRLGWPHGRRR